MCVLLAILMSGSPVWGSETPPTTAALEAEAIRLSDEVAKATRKNAWKAVERHYQSALSTGVPVPASVHLAASEAAHLRGDLGAMRARLYSVISLEPTHTQAVNSLAALDRTYARVQLMAPLGAELAAYQKSFDPNAVRSVAFATATLAETGAFVGLLPPGSYTIDGDPFEVPLGIQTVFDLSLPPPPPEEPRPFWRPR